MSNACPTNTEIKNTIVVILEDGKEFSVADLRKTVIEKMNLSEEQLNETTGSGNGNRFKIRYSAQLSELIKAGKATKENNLVSKA